MKIAVSFDFDDCIINHSLPEPEKMKDTIKKVNLIKQCFPKKHFDYYMHSSWRFSIFDGKIDEELPLETPGYQEVYYILKELKPISTDIYEERFESINKLAKHYDLVIAFDDAYWDIDEKLNNIIFVNTNAENFEECVLFTKNYLITLAKTLKEKYEQNT